METSTTPDRAKKAERGGSDKTRKGFSLKRKLSLADIGIAFTFLLAIKVIIAIFYLNSDSAHLPTTTLALAESKVKKESPKGVAGNATTMDRLKRKEKAIKKKEIALKKKEAELIPLQKEIEGKLAELNELQAQLTAYAKKLGDREEALKDSKNEHLVALYTAMDPAKAAAIMEKLKISTVVIILRHMKGKSAGQIMAMMNPERGARISEKLNQLD